MTWFKSDDSFWRHRKVRKLGKDKLAAVGLWTVCGTWCADNVMTNVTDGFVPAEVVEQSGDTRHRVAKRLVAVGLWEEVEIDGEHGYVFHDWADYNPTKAEVEAEREKWRAKKAGQRKGKPRPPTSPGDKPGDTTGESQGSPKEFPDPIPVPVPVPSSGSFRGDGHQGNANTKRPPTRCPQHANDDRPPPCGPCAGARRAAETWDTERAAAATAAIRGCPFCDADGRRWHPDGKRHGTVGPCDHQPPHRATG